MVQGLVSLQQKRRNLTNTTMLSVLANVASSKYRYRNELILFIVGRCVKLTVKRSTSMLCAVNGTKLIPVQRMTALFNHSICFSISTHV